MASHSGYPHMHHTMHSQPSSHLPPPPHSSVAQAPDLRLPSLRSLNFAYPPVGEPGSASTEGPSQTPQREQQPRAQFAQQDEYYHQRDMYYQEAASSSSHTSLAPPPTKRPRSASNSSGRSPYALQPPHTLHNTSSSSYHTQSHDPQTRSSTGGGGYAQGHPQVHAQGHPQGHPQYPQQHAHQQQPDSGHTTQPSYYNRLPQPPQAWYYSSGHQPGQQHHPPPQSSPQQPQQQQQQPQQQQPQQQQHQSLQNAPPKLPVHYQPYPPAHAIPNSPHQAPGPAPPHRGTTNSTTSFSVASSQQGHAPSASASSQGVLTGPGSTSTTTSNTVGYGSPPTSSFTAPGSGLGAGPGNSRSIDAKALGDDTDRAAAVGMHLSKITEHCTALCDFANHYAQLPHLRPSPTEVSEMAQRATLVLQLVEHLRRISSPAIPMQSPPFANAVIGTSERSSSFSMLGGGDRGGEKESAEERGGAGVARTSSKKRPWEDVVTSQGGGADDAADERSGGDDNSLSPSFNDTKDGGAMRSLAETDMAIIRSKRGQGTGAAGAPPGAPKAKYRKRSRATPPGKCHSCNIRETPEWRRGPDGARTLCNACGLHYAKLLRKRDKLGSGGDADGPPIDLEMLRASTRLAGDQPGPKPSISMQSDTGYRDSDDMAEIHLQPVNAPGPRGLAPQMGVTMQVHQWTPPTTQREEGGYELSAYSTSLMRSSNARASPP